MRNINVEVHFVDLAKECIMFYFASEITALRCANYMKLAENVKMIKVYEIGGFVTTIEGSVIKL